MRIMSLDQIKPNARTHSAKQIRQIANSILGFGFTNPLLLDEHGELIAGHGRYQAAKLLHDKKRPGVAAFAANRRSLFEHFDDPT